MNYTHWLVILSALISIGGASFYIRDTLKGKTKPNRISWSMWAIVPLIATGAALSAKADFWATTRIFLAGFLPLLIFLASFLNKKSYWKLTFFDGLCGIFCLLAIFVWLAINSPKTAILLAIIADSFAALPTIKKAWQSPKSETGLTFLANLIAALLVYPSIQIWNIENAGFQIYLVTVDLIILMGIYQTKIFKFAKLAK